MKMELLALISWVFAYPYYMCTVMLQYIACTLLLRTFKSKGGPCVFRLQSFWLGKSHYLHSGNSCSERECEASLFCYCWYNLCNNWGRG